MWQSLVESLGDENFTVLAVALDEPEAARPWIEAASPAHACLVDREHRVAELYHLVNVPQAAWIDEAGRIVRPPENAGSTDGFREMDRQSLAIPAQALSERQRVKQAYAAAVKDWAQRGAEAARLHPDSWAIWRQGAAKDAGGPAVGAEFWARMDVLGDRPCHRPVAADIAGAPRQTTIAEAPPSTDTIAPET